jgi:hypothetical protein
MINIPITGGFYESDSLPISAQQCINWYVNIPQTENALTQGSLFGTPGLSQITTTGTVANANRGLWVKDGVPYYLNGETLYRLDRTVDSLGVETFNQVTLGSIPGTDRASFSDNGKQLIVISDGNGWIIDETAVPVFDPITSPGFTANGTPEQVVFIDSFFIVTTDSKKFIRSAANDGKTWSALDFFTAEADPDDIVAPIVLKNQLLIAGSQTIEFYQDLAGQFQRINGMIINKGVAAAFGIANTSDSVMFVGGGINESPAIWRVQSNTAQKVSTTAIDAVLNKLSKEDIEACFAWSYAQSGAYFVGFTFPDNTFVFDTVTGRWHERESQITNARGLTEVIRWRAQSFGEAYNRILCGDSIDGRIGELDLDIFDEYGDNINRTFVTIPFSNQGLSFSVSKLEATMESGVGTATLDPQLRLSFSKDGGKTYNNELWRGFGKIGKYITRAIFRRLGRFPRYAVMKFEMSEKVKPVFIKLEAQIRGGNGN